MQKPDFITQIITFLLRIFAYKEKLDLEWWKKPTEPSSPSVEIFRKYEVSFDLLYDRKTWNISPDDSTSEKVILYIHGGGFHKGVLDIHWNFIDELCEDLQQSVIVPDFPLSPEATATDTLAFLLECYKTVSDQFGSVNITLMGDSSGGGLCHALCQEMVRNKIDQPDQLVLLSPWLDLTLSNPLIEDIENRDPLLNVQPLRKIGTEYAGAIEMTDPRISPVYGKIRRIAPTTVFIGSNDIMLADCRKLKLKAESEPVVFNYREFNGRFHNWMFFNTPDGKKTRSMIFSQIRYPVSEAEEVLSANTDFWKKVS